MLSPSPESAFAVRILTDGKSPRRPAGAGFLVTPQHVVTCAHVVNEALGRKQTAAECPPLPVLLDFPLLHGQQAAQAKLLRWFPVKADAAFGELEDIAILELLPDTPLPAAAQPAPLVLLDGDGRQLSGQEVRMYGFSVPDGTYANGVLQGLTAKGWAEIHHADSGSVDRGFSGAAVWSVRENAVCGMIVSMLSSAASYMIPAAALIQAFPELDKCSRPVNPYRGMEAFREKDARFYFGREADAAKLKEKIEKQPFTAVIGASGSGKSSLVFAGLLPLLRQDGGWLCADCKPRHQPFAQLSVCLVPFLYEDELERVKKSRLCAADLLAGELLLSDLLRRIADRNEHRRFLLIVDQFEELFTLNADSGLRQRFIASLLDAAEAEGVAVLLTMRADFLETALGDSCFAKKLNDCPPLLLAPMGGAELKQAAERPAELLGIRFEPGLADLLVAELDSEPGSLPLLEFCLTQLWEQQQFRQISHAAYKGSGGVQQALARHAEAVYAGFAAMDQEAVRLIFLKLVRPGQGTEDTRQVAALADFQEEQRGLIKQLTDQRLLVTSGDKAGQQVEVVHEALIRHWQTLRKWVDAEREFLVWRDKLRVLLRQWKESEKDEGALLRGLPLDEALQWRGSHAGYLGEEELGFVRESETARIKQRRRKNTSIAAVLLTAAAVVAVVFVLWKNAEQQQVVAEQKTVEARYNVAKAFEEKAMTALKAANGKGDVEYKKAALFASAALEQKIPADKNVLRLESTSELFTATAFQAGLAELAVLKGHKYWVNSASFSPDGRRIMSASEDHTVRIWDAESGKELTILKGHDAPVRSASFSPDGKRIVSASDDSTVRIWDAESGKELTILKRHESTISSAFFSPDGRRILSASYNLRIWDTENGHELADLKGHQNYVLSASFSPDGKRIVSASMDKTVRIWDAENGKELAVLKGHKDVVRSASFSPDGRRIVSASEDCTVRIWDAESGKELAVLKGHEIPVGNAFFSPDGRRIVSFSIPIFSSIVASGENARIWDAESGKELAVLKGHKHWVGSASFSPDGRRIVTASYDKTIRIWDAENGKELAVLKGNKDVVRSASFSPDGRRILSASNDKTVRLWGNEQGTFKNYEENNNNNKINSAFFSPDGRRIVTASYDKTVRILDATNGQTLAVLKGHEDNIKSASFSPDGKHIVSASWDKTVRIWDAENGRELAVLKGHEDNVNTASFGPDGKRIVSTSLDKTVRIWDTEDGQVLAVLKGNNDSVHSASFSPDGKRIVSASWDKTVRIWDAENGRELAVLKGHKDNVNTASFSPDGKRIVSASWDKTVRIWDAENGRELAVLKGHENWVNSASFSSDGRFIISASEDHNVRIWDAESGEILTVLRGHAYRVNTASFSPDGRQVVSTSLKMLNDGLGDNIVRLWDVRPYTLFLDNSKPTPLYHTFIQAVKFLW